MQQAMGRQVAKGPAFSLMLASAVMVTPARAFNAAVALRPAFARMRASAPSKLAIGRQNLRGGGYKYEAGTARGIFHTAMKGDHEYDYDYLCIGGGSGGVRSSRIAAGHGAKVALVECASGGDKKEGGFGGLGGTCVNVGCVPKKLMVYGAHYAHDVHDMVNYGWEGASPSLNWKNFIANKNKEIARLNGIYQNMLKNAGVELIDGYAKLVDGHTVEIDGKKVTAQTILVAVGGWPMMPKVDGGELAITSNEAFFLDERPNRVVVVGGGYIAIEFANIFKGYGADVTQIYRGDLWLRGFDGDVRQHLVTEYKEQGINLKFNTNIQKMEKNADGSIKVTYEDGSTQETDIVMYATGRVPRTKDLGCEAAGVKMDSNGAIIVDEGFQTSVPSIYAVGDVINRIQLTPIALAEGHCLADTLFGGKPRKTDYSDVPTAVFSNPPIGTVGLTEEEARAKHKNVHIYRSSFRGMKHTITGRQEKTLMKLVVNADDDKILGVHMVGDAAGEVIQLAGVAMKAGCTKADFDGTIGVHPTAAEEFCTMRTRVPDPEPAKEKAPALAEKR